VMSATRVMPAVRHKGSMRFKVVRGSTVRCPSSI